MSLTSSNDTSIIHHAEDNVESESTQPLDSIKTSLSDAFSGVDLPETDLESEGITPTTSSEGLQRGVELRINTRPSDLEVAIEEEVDEERSVSPNEGPSVWYMIKTNSCCIRRRHYNAPPRKRLERCVNIVKWTLWAVTTGLHLYFLNHMYRCDG